MKIVNTGVKLPNNIKGAQLGVGVRNDKDKLSGKQGGKDGKVSPPRGGLIRPPQDHFDPGPAKHRKP